MNIKSKKNVAREFLILLVCIAVSIVTFLTIYGYNFFKQVSIDRLNKDIVSTKLLSDSLSKPYRVKFERQIWYTNNYTSKFGDQNYDNAHLWGRLYEIANVDSMKIKWEKIWSVELVSFNKKLGFNTPESFQTFILKNMIYKTDVDLNQKAIDIHLQVDSLQNTISETSNKIVSTENQISTAGLVFIVAVIALFLLRYIYYGITWSVKTLKNS